jgi:YebC/PmpR family DNA-binding regulatory protein
MSGHSKWATIKRAKEATDAKRSSAFSKLSKDIILATRLGQSGDINFNPMLRVAVTKAKDGNMPNEKIEKAIKRGMGVVGEGEQVHEKIYEGYSASGVPILVEVQTDNPNRTLTEIRTIINKSGGKMVPEGSVSWQFREFGLLKATLHVEKGSEDDEVLNLLSIDGVEDVEFEIDDLGIELTIYTKKDSLRIVSDKLKSEFSEKVNISEITIILENPNKVMLNESEISKFSELIEIIKENEDVSNVWY